MRPARHLVLYSALITSGWLTPIGCLFASPWAEPNDRALRHAVEVVRDTQLLPGPITTWPIAWQALSQALEALPRQALTEQQQQAVSFLKNAIKQADRTRLTSSFSTASHPHTLNGFADNVREKSEASVSFDAMGDIFAINLSASYVSNPSDDASWRADNSYLAARLGNWGLGIGTQERFWGPAWQSSLILSNNARPTPGLFIQRLSPEAFETPLLSWIGPWQVTSFLSQLEGARDYSHPKLWGLRFSNSPFSFLELGFSRTALFGGGDRPESLGVLTDLFLGHDNRGGGGIADDASNEPGDQLGGIDWRASFHVTPFSGAWYGQLIGEDEAGGTPSRSVGSMGFELSGATAGVSHRAWLEGSNSLMRFTSEGIPSGTYEHGIYTNGYRYHGRSLGASSDNDSQVYTLGGLHAWEEGDLLTWRIAKAYINHDGTNLPPPGGNPLSDSAVSLVIVEASLQHNLTESSQVLLGGQYLQHPLNTRWQRLDSNLYITLKSSW
jgi:Capsule assembly protein Wzi